MNLLGFEITRRKAQGLQSVSSSYGSWLSNIFGPIREPYAQAWQHNVELAPTQTLLSFSAVYACIRGISSDIAKMRVKLSEDDDGIWTEITQNQPWLPVLRKPNGYQSRADFFESWMISKLMYGNTYVLKIREDRRGIVTGMHVLHPNCVKPLVAADGSVYYEIREDFLAQTPLVDALSVEGRIVIPPSEIMHDLMMPLWHPKVGISPLYACALSGTVGNNIENNSAFFFQNRAMPGGVLEAPGAVSDDTVRQLKADWQSNFTGVNRGKVAVLADGLKFSAMNPMTAEAAQQTEQLKFAVEDVARAFGYPIWKLSGTTPPYTKPAEGQVLYFSDCLQIHIVKIEESLDNGLELPLGMHTELDVEELLRMDRQALYETLNAAGKFLTLDEQRFEANKGKIKGGNTVYKQEQEHAVEALFNRDQSDDPFGTKKPAPAPAEEPESKPEPESEPADTRQLDEDEMELLYAAELRRELTIA